VKKEEQLMYDRISPGDIWLDTDGNRIQAHGASIICVEDTYYLYGENKDKTYADTDYWYNGVNCYSSKDLMNWKYEGVILKAAEDFRSPLHHSKKCDRPHILYNKKTKKYVMWIKVMGDASVEELDYEADTRQFMCIATSDSIVGEFEFVKKIYPIDMYSGDFDLYADPIDGKGYIIFGRPHTEVIIADLTSDYLDVSGYYTQHFPHPGPITSREAPCLFRKDGRFYLITSGTSGYFPNPSEIATAELIHGPWKVLGNPCVDDGYNDSFNCQFGSVFKVPGKELYIALGDRWMTGTPLELAARGQMNTALATYVWLPIKFEDNMPVIEWKDSWSPVDFPDEVLVDSIQAMSIQMRSLAASIMKRKEEENQ
jgi:beta-xylosidase